MTMMQLADYLAKAKIPMGDKMKKSEVEDTFVAGASIVKNDGTVVTDKAARKFILEIADSEAAELCVGGTVQGHKHWSKSEQMMSKISSRITAELIKKGKLEVGAQGGAAVAKAAWTESMRQIKAELCTMMFMKSISEDDKYNQNGD